MIKLIDGICHKQRSRQKIFMLGNPNPVAEVEGRCYSYTYEVQIVSETITDGDTVILDGDILKKGRSTVYV